MYNTSHPAKTESEKQVNLPSKEPIAILTEEMQKEELKRKARFVNSFTVMSWLMYIICFIIVVSVKRINFTQLKFTLDFSAFLNILTNLITALVSLVLMVRFFQLYKQRSTIVNLVLASFFLFSCIPAILVGLQNFIISSSDDLQYFMSLATFYLIPGTTVMLGCFITETFYGGMDKKPDSYLFYITNTISTVANVIALILSLGGRNYIFPIWVRILIMIFGGFFILLNVFLYFLLAYNAVKLRLKVHEKKYQIGLALLILTGVLLGLNFFGRLATFLLLQPELIFPQSFIFTGFLDIIYVVGYIAFYLGVTLPKS